MFKILQDYKQEYSGTSSTQCPSTFAATERTIMFTNVQVKKHESKEIPQKRKE